MFFNYLSPEIKALPPSFFSYERINDALKLFNFFKLGKNFPTNRPDDLTD